MTRTSTRETWTTIRTTSPKQRIKAANLILSNQIGMVKFTNDHTEVLYSGRVSRPSLIRRLKRGGIKLAKEKK